MRYGLPVWVEHFKKGGKRMLYRQIHTLQITGGPCRPDLAMAWSLAGSPTHKDSSIVEFVSSDGKKRPAIIRGLTYANTTDDSVVKISGKIAWQMYEDPAVGPQVKIKTPTGDNIWAKSLAMTAKNAIMPDFTGTYDVRRRSGQFEVEYYTADDKK